jgi:hypothetical protein
MRSLTFLPIALVLSGGSASAEQTLACWLPQSGAYFALTSKVVEFENSWMREWPLAYTRAGLGQLAVGKWCTVVLSGEDGFARYHGEFRLVPNGERAIDPSKVLFETGLAAD